MGIFSKPKRSQEDEVNQINNRKYKEVLLDHALAVLVDQNEIQTKDLEGVKAEFGHLLNIPGHGIEALFKIMKDDKVFYFAMQQNALKYLTINEEQFKSVTENMIRMHLNGN